MTHLNAALPADATQGEIISDTDHARIRADLRKVYVGRQTDITVGATLRKLLAERKQWSDLKARREAGDAEADAEEAYECRAIVLTGDSGAGKSTLLRRALGPSRPGANDLPIVSQQVPGPCTRLTLGHALLRTLGYPMSDHAKEHVVMKRVREHLAAANTDILHLDEVQNITGTANVKEARKILDNLRSYLIDPEHPVILVLSGLPEIKPFLSGDTQIRRRADFLWLETLTPDDADTLRGVIERLATKADLNVDFRDELLPRLMHAAGHQFGSAVELSVEAALSAVRPLDDRGETLPRGTRLAREHFGDVFAGRSGNAPFANPFLAPNWHRVDPTLVGITHPGQLPADEPPLPKQRPTKPKKPRGKSR